MKIFSLSLGFSLLLTMVYCERRIFGGKLAELGQFPYQVRIWTNFKEGLLLCTGTIIHRRWVLTAAHCVVDDYDEATVDPQAITVQAGLVKSSDSEKSHVQNRQPKNVIAHEKYGSHIGEHDLALLELKEDFVFNDHVGVIELSDDEWPSNDARVCTLAGFGDTEQAHQSIDLRYLELEVHHGERSCPCIAKRFQLRRLVCTIAKAGKGACMGDSGGGMICDGKVVGITHMGLDKRACSYFKSYPTGEDIDCGSEEVYGIYMYVCPYLDWIKNHVPEVPATPQSCYAFKIYPSITVIIFCLSILFILSF